ncbi:MAG: hypothetical protein ACREOM_03125 [Candidatus Dormibacteraceae bacterium]
MGSSNKGDAASSPGAPRELAHANAPGPQRVGRLRKRTVIKTDGRYLVYYESA